MNYDRWLEAPFQAAEARAEAIDAEVERLLADEADPLNLENFLDALAEWDSVVPFAKRLEEALTDPEPNFEALGRVVFDIAYGHWRTYAENLAAERYNCRIRDF